ncbi:hypothetical protein M8C21_029142 [Ambrosia artemisiifolia]|uniref:Peptide chain release factor domain-containing protein n=1 Tax=Ambrosia artemisiifolia TaxID=4212 RepID=A0AAD5GN59_AMBAR|nr:hypothetical protein M8C21_029142 [Ambrosia artemisiifolia]
MRQSVKEKELEALLAGEHDSCSCYIEVQAGAGGTESMDWAGMVMQMYKMWAQRQGYVVTVVDEMRGEIAGVKRATLKVDGEYAYGYAKAEVVDLEEDDQDDEDEIPGNHREGPSKGDQILKLDEQEQLNKKGAMRAPGSSTRYMGT